MDSFLGKETFSYLNMTAISVIIPTYNGRSKIEGLLKSLEAQTVIDFETIIVVDGSTDDTLPFLSQRDFLLSEIRIVSQLNKGRAGARNAGTLQAKGDVLIFFDDDLVIPPEAVERYVERFKQGTAEVYGGLFLPLKGEASTDFFLFCSYLNEKWNKSIPAKYSIDANNKVYFSAASMCISRKIFMNLGGFNEELSDNEDQEFGQRLVDQGYRISLDRHPVAFHTVHGSFQDYIVRLREYESARCRPEKRTTIACFRHLIGSLLAHSLTVQMMEKGFFRCIPRLLRFKFYDFVVTALSVDFMGRKIK